MVKTFLQRGFPFLILTEILRLSINCSSVSLHKNILVRSFLFVINCLFIAGEYDDTYVVNAEFLSNISLVVFVILFNALFVSSDIGDGGNIEVLFLTLL